MGLEAVVEEVISSAKEEARKILMEGKKEAKKIIAEAEKETRKYEESFRNETRKMLEDMERKELASAKLEAAKIIMETKKRVMDDFLKSVAESLAKLEKKKKEKLLQSLADMAKSEMKVHTVYCNSEEEEIIKKLFRNATIKHIDCAGGFVVENKEGTMSMDLTYETLVGRIKLELLKILNTELMDKKA